MDVFLVEGYGTENIREKINSIADIVDTPQHAELILAVGGDNTMLRAIHDFKHLRVPFMGINKGHVGFLMNDYLPSTFLGFDNMVNTAETMNLWMLEGEVRFVGSGFTKIVKGFNDIYFSPKDGQALRMRLTIDDIEVPDDIVGDGFIVSTPQGSTGYNRSARGKIIRPGSPILQLTPMACTIGERRSILDSFVEPDSTVFKVEFLQPQFRQPKIMFDGFSFDSDTQIESITFRKSNEEVQLMFGDKFNFYEKIYRLKFHQ